LNFRPWRLVRELRATRLGRRLSLKLQLGFWALIPHLCTGSLGERLRKGLGGAVRRGCKEGLIVCRSVFRVVLHNLGVFCKGFLALLMAKSS
jgi:hypothetical protein